MQVWGYYYLSRFSSEKKWEIKNICLHFLAAVESLQLWVQQFNMWISCLWVGSVSWGDRYYFPFNLKKFDRICFCDNFQELNFVSLFLFELDGLLNFVGKDY